MMKLMMSTALAGLFLCACGGGGDSPPSSSSVPPVRTEPGTPEGNVPPDKPGTSVSAPPIDAQAMTLSAPSIHMQMNASSIVVRREGLSNLDLSGTNNKAWISENQAMDAITVGGSSNTLIMMRGATVNTLTVARGNTVYLPFGSTIAVQGSGATVKYYGG